MAGQFTGLHILDDPMPDYGEHESDGDPLQTLRHSTAHLLAAAVTELYPNAKYGIGPAVQDGFYYDFDFGHPISAADLPAIESRMRRLAQADIPFVHEVVSRDQAIEEFRKRGQDYKLELIADKVGGDGVSLYRTGEFLDLCRGPHVRSTRDLKAFKLLRVAGAYWRGDEKRPQLTRIYGTAWQTQRELDDYLKFMEEAEKRDHKKLGKDLKIFTLDERLGLGQVVWLPNGATIRRELERWIIDEELKRGYRHVITPHLAKLDLYKQSGHWELFHDTMYPPMRFEDGEELELRPMNCPHHIIVYSHDLYSYRDLPVRIAELGQNYRLEKSGELMGMVRVRSFNLNDAHIFCTPDQVIAEVRAAGTDEEWETAEAMLKEALESLNLPYRVGVGEAAFYGPKIDFQVMDAHRREFTNNTVQVDYQLPKKFDLEYVAEDGSRQRPVLVHRGAFGAFERMTAFLIEHYAGAFPTWLHPVQIVVIPITDAQRDYAGTVAERLRALRLRVEVDDRSERMQRKIRDAQAQKVPYMAIVGAREAESEHVNVRDRSGGQVDSSLEAFGSMVAAEVAERRR
jgi:threonyl-tRNA synthetase